MWGAFQLSGDWRALPGWCTRRQDAPLALPARRR